MGPCNCWRGCSARHATPTRSWGSSPRWVATTPVRVAVGARRSSATSNRWRAEGEDMELWELAAREACRDTLAQYNHAGDRYLLEEFAAAFCEDGVLEIRGSAPIPGRPAIIERFGGQTTAMQARTAARQQPADAQRRIVRHNVTNIRFESV